MIKYYMSEELQRLPMASGLTTPDLRWMDRMARRVDEMSQSKADLVGGKIPASQLPSYVDDVIEYDGSFPATGESGKIYVDTGTGKTYRWSGTRYTEIANPDLSGLKTKQTAVENPGASGTGLAFVDSITQDENGVVTPTRKSVKKSDDPLAGSSGTVATTLATANGAKAVAPAFEPNKAYAAGDAVLVSVDNVPTRYVCKAAYTSTTTKPDADAVHWKAEPLQAAIDDKVDKETGKGLSTNDFTAGYKDKLDGLDANLAKRVPLEADVEGTFTAATIGVQRKPNSAKGKLSLVQGYLCAAEGDASHAEGDRTEATQVASHAEGSQTSATADAAHAEGGSTKAAGVASHAEGLYTRSSGYAAHAEGTNADGLVQGVDGTAAAGPFSHTEGLMCETKEAGFGSHAEGFRASDDGKSFSFVWQGYGGDVPSAAQMADLIANGPASPAGGAAAVGYLTAALNNLSAYKAKHKGAFCVNPVPASGSNDPASGLFVGDTSLAQMLAGKVAANTAVVGGTKCKITFDSKGLVTAGTDLVASDIPMLSTAKLSDFATAVRYSSNSATVTPSSGNPVLPDSCYPIVVTLGGEEHSIEDASGVNLYFDESINTWMLNGDGPLDFTLASFDENTLAFGGMGSLDSITFGGRTPVQGSFPRLSSPPAAVTNVADRAVNAFTLSGDASLTLPNGTPDRSRDFYLKVAASAASTIVVTGATLKNGAGNAAALSVPADATKTWHLVETADGTFLVHDLSPLAGRFYYYDQPDFVVTALRDIIAALGGVTDTAD